MSQGSLFTTDAPVDYGEPVPAPDSEIIRYLKDLNLDECTPMQALIHLSKLKEEAENI